MVGYHCLAGDGDVASASKLFMITMSLLCACWPALLKPFFSKPSVMLGECVSTAIGTKISETENPATRGDTDHAHIFLWPVA